MDRREWICWNGFTGMDSSGLARGRLSKICQCGFAAIDLLERIYWCGSAGEDWLVWICRIGFARDDLPEEINWAGLAGVDLLERIYRNGLAGVDLPARIRWG